MYDLIYADYKAQKILEKRYPNAKFEDASDDIHRERFSIDIEESEYNERDYLKFLLESGLYSVSFDFQLMRVSEEHVHKINNAAKELREEKPELFKDNSKKESP